MVDILGKDLNCHKDSQRTKGRCKESQENDECIKWKYQ